MPRIPYAEPGSEASGATPYYQNMEKMMGMVPNLVKLTGHSGGATKGLGELLGSYFSELKLSDRTREVAYLTVARHNGCAYCQGHHEPLARQAGLSDDEIALLGPDGFDSEHLSKPDRAVVRFAWETSRNVEASDEAVEALKQHFDHEAIAEIAFTVAAGNFIQRIGRNLGVDLEF